MSALIDPADQYEWMPRAASMTSQAKPVLKWVGGKAQLEGPILKEIARLHPGVINHYYEPFAGGLAIFFALRRRFCIKTATLSDANEELINFYQQIQNEPEGLIIALRKLKKQGFSEKRYYEVRASKPKSDAGRAARFKYINACGYNGLWRVNKKNECNVPWGRRVRAPEICDEDALWAAHHALAIAEIKHESFERALMAPVLYPGFVYLDPPYWPKRPTASFTSYTSVGFGAESQVTLAHLLRRIACDGTSTALLSNSDVPATRKLYLDFKKKKVLARRNVNSVGTKRGQVSELLVSSEFK